jgi:Xaa-Pro aminopeptidase
MKCHERIQEVRRAIREWGIDALWITSIVNVRYLSGFTGSSASCLVSDRSAVLITDFRYREQASREVKGMRIEMVSGGGMEGAAARIAKRRGITALGIESRHLTYRRYGEMRRLVRGTARLVPTDMLVEGIRVVKDSDERSVLRKLARMTDTVLASCKRRIVDGMTERDLAHLIGEEAYRAGADGLAFEPIVASGRRSAMPHHRSGNFTIRPGQPLLIDFGLRYNGYNSDLTRTFYYGRVTRHYRELYAIVLEAQRVAIGHVREGVPLVEVDAAARRYIRSNGYGKCFGHALGHGIGLEVHEEPRLSPRSTGILESGMILTVEPGIYREDWGGIRIEDMVLVETNGCTLLTRGRKDIEDSLL